MTVRRANCDTTRLRSSTINRYCLHGKKHYISTIVASVETTCSKYPPAAGCSLLRKTKSAHIACRTFFQCRLSVDRFRYVTLVHFKHHSPHMTIKCVKKLVALVVPNEVSDITTNQLLVIRHATTC